jgi:hypothetical protein
MTWPWSRSRAAPRARYDPALCPAPPSGRGSVWAPGGGSGRRAAAPSEPNSPRRTNPIPRAERTRASAFRSPPFAFVRHGWFTHPRGLASAAQAPAPSEPGARRNEPNSSRRANPRPAPNEPNSPRRANPIPRAERTRSAAPSEPNLLRRANPISCAERTQSRAPSEPERPRRFATARLRTAQGRDAGPRTAHDLIVKEHPKSS